MNDQAAAELKQAHKSTWDEGDFDTVAKHAIWDLGPRMAERVGAEAGMDVLDVACGTGNFAIPAAQQGARVVGLDLAPGLLEDARRNADEAGVEVDWIEGDAEALPFEDASFDIVGSIFGAMFAPRHAVVASELARVLRPGGKLVMFNWTPGGVIGQMIATIGGEMPPPPDFASPPILWGDPDHVAGLFDGPGLALNTELETVQLLDESVRNYLDVFSTKFGPTVVARRALEPQGRWEPLFERLVQLYDEHNEADDEMRINAEFLVVEATRPG